MFPSERWTIVEPLLASDERYGITMAIDGAPGNIMTIDELHRSLSTVTPFSTTVIKNTPTFLKDIGRNNGFLLENSGGQPQFSRKILRHRRIGGS